MRPLLAVVFYAAVVPSVAAEKTPSFSDFATGAEYRGRLARPVLDTANAHTYRSRLIAGAAQAPNFASHYRLVEWGCGTSCVMGAVVDSISGAVNFIPFSMCCYSGPMDADFNAIEVRPQSSLIIFKGQRNEEGTEGPHFYFFDGKRFQLVASKSADGASTNAATTTASPGLGEVNTCQKIADEGARLKCYDAVSGFKR